MNRIIPLVCVFPFLLSGCAFPLLPSSIYYSGPEQGALLVPADEPVVQEPQVLELAVIEGKTTKQEVINALGTPQTMANLGNNEQTMVYYYIKSQNVICRIKLREKDGTVWNEVLGEREGAINSVQFILKRGVVQSVNLGL